jgi:hypothetical protein
MMIIHFNHFQEDPWIDLKQIDVEVTWHVRADIHPVNVLLEKKTIVPSDDLSCYMRGVQFMDFDRYEYRLRLQGEYPLGIQGYGARHGSPNLTHLLFIQVHRVSFKSGIVLKTREDIAMHFFPTYGTIEREILARHKHRFIRWKKGR